MKPSLYLETTIVSYLTARTSRDLIVAAHQQITQDWWEYNRQKFDLYTSQLVLEEASGGDTIAASKRVSVLEKMALRHLLWE